MKNPKDKAIIIFARLPAEGRVKTRLAKEIGDKNAAEFYRVCAEHLFLEVLKLKKQSIDLFLFYSDKNQADQVKKWAGDGFYFYSQTGNCLGGRMLDAFQLVFNKGYNKTIIVGTDVPDINSQLLFNAFDELDKNDFVIGPSQDGGYYLLGMKSLEPELFIGIEWGTEKVFNDTLEKLNGKNISAKIMKKLTDIDTKKDLVQWYHQAGINFDHPVKIFVESIKKSFD